MNSMESGALFVCVGLLISLHAAKFIEKVEPAPIACYVVEKPDE